MWMSSWEKFEFFFVYVLKDKFQDCFLHSKALTSNIALRKDFLGYRLMDLLYIGFYH